MNLLILCIGALGAILSYEYYSPSKVEDIPPGFNPNSNLQVTNNPITQYQNGGINKKKTKKRRKKNTNKSCKKN